MNSTSDSSNSGSTNTNRFKMLTNYNGNNQLKENNHLIKKKQINTDIVYANIDQQDFKYSKYMA